MAHDPGGKTSWPLLPGVKGSAFMSEDGRARFELHRWWSIDRIADMMWVGMNPSTAHGLVDDPTVRKEQLITQARGYRGMVKVNLAAIRATNPAHVTAEDVAKYHDENMATIERCMRVAILVVAAWGVVPQCMRHLPAELVAMAKRLDVQLWCLDTTKDGHPRHPLYVAKASPLRMWPG